MSHLSITHAELEDLSARTNFSVELQESPEETRKDSLRRKIFLTLEDPTYSPLVF